MGPQSSSIMHSWEGGRDSFVRKMQRCRRSECPGRAESGFIPVLGEARPRSVCWLQPTPGPAQAGWCLAPTLRLQSTQGLSSQDPKSLEPPTSITRLTSVFSVPHIQGCEHGDAKLLIRRTDVLIKGANEFQALCDYAERAGSQAQHSPCCLGRYQRPPPQAPGF